MNINDEFVRINDFISRSNYHAAINLSISAMNECRRSQDQQGVDRFIDLMQTIIDQMREKFASK